MTTIRTHTDDQALAILAEAYSRGRYDIAMLTANIGLHPATAEELQTRGYMEAFTLGTMYRTGRLRDLPHTRGGGCGCLRCRLERIHQRYTPPVVHVATPPRDWIRVENVLVVVAVVVVLAYVGLLAWHAYDVMLVSLLP